MRLFGWGLIVLFGGGMLYMLSDWVVRSVNGYYVDGESMIALAVMGIVGVLALVPIGIGAWLVRRDSQRSEPDLG